MVKFAVVVVVGLLFGVGAFTSYRWIAEHWALWGETHPATVGSLWRQNLAEFEPLLF